MDPVVEIRQPGRQALYVVVRSATLLGRECDGVLIADAQVSRRHLELRPHDGRLLCADLGSRNGTDIDGTPLTEPVLLDSNMVITMGDTTIRLFEPVGPTGPSSFAQTSLGDALLRQTSIDLVADHVAAAGWEPALDGETVTILFSDIESSTEQASQLGDAAWFALLDAHNLLFREELSKTGGREIKSQGDGFMLTFPSVRRALHFAVEVQRRLRDSDENDLLVRMGLHTGEAILDSAGDLFGRHVNKAARVANLAAGGQILASATVREIARGANEFEFGDRTNVELKGLEGLHTVHEVRW